MSASMFSAALVAALVGYGSTIVLILSAAQAVGANAAQTASWVAAICIAKGIGSAFLSTWSRVPVVLAWSTPGAALIAASTGINIHEAVGAFIFAGVLIALTGVIPVLNRAINMIPPSVASGLLAGVLLPFCTAVASYAVSDPKLVLPLVAIFLVVRLISPTYAVLAALAGGLVIAFSVSGAAAPSFAFDGQPFVFIMPEFSLAVLVGLGLPLYIVTMASQNLPGFAVLQAHGYAPPVSAALGVTGFGSAIAGLFGSHTFSMAAITAAICLGDDVHPDKAQRWRVGLAYAAIWIALGIFGPVFIATILVMPKAIILAVAGLALIMPMMGAAAAGFEAPETRFAAASTFIITASGIAVFGIGSAFWALMVGLAIHLLDRRGK